ncbi:PfkB family carbohydrate kinase [Arthrobacter pigmenti]
MLGCVGDNTVDQYFGAADRRLIGGNAVNVAVQLRLLGADVQYAGAVGTDNNGRWIRNALSRYGLGLSGLITVEGSTSISRIRVEVDGERCIEDEDFAVCAEYLPDQAAIETLAGCAVVHLGMNPNANEIRLILKAEGVTVTQDCAVSAGFENLDVAFCSAGEDPEDAAALAEAAISEGAKLALVTRGSQGSLAFDGQDWLHQEAVPTTVVDTTGAGDSYIAGFIDSMARNHHIQECMRAGALTAAKTCAHWGGFPQAPLPDIPAENATGIQKNESLQ